jgi:hypothetical protein
MHYFVGLDWAAREHAVCGAVVAQFTVAHTAAGMRELAARLVKLAPPAGLRIAIARPTGLVVDTLVEGKFAVVRIHPNVVKSARARYSAAQGKTDLGDAYLLADLLRTDGHRFRTLVLLSDETEALRGLVRVRDDLVGRRVAAANQLRCLLEQFLPGAAQVVADVDSPIALEFLDRYPSPQSASSVGERRMAAFLARHWCRRGARRVRGRCIHRFLRALLRSEVSGMQSVPINERAGCRVLEHLDEPGASRLVMRATRARLPEHTPREVYRGRARGVAAVIRMLVADPFAMGLLDVVRRRVVRDA